MTTEVQQEKGYNGLSIASMVLGIVWLGWLGSILALVFGYIARRQIKRNGEKGGGFAITGIVLGWVGVGTFILWTTLAILGAVMASDSTNDYNRYNDCINNAQSLDEMANC